MKDIIVKSKIKPKNLPHKLTIMIKWMFIINPKWPMLSVISLQILVVNWPVKYQNHLKHLKHISIK